MNDQVKEKSWEEFRDTGLLWFINSILHLFGWAICIELDEDKIISVYPSRVSYRGFSEGINTIGYQKISKFLKDNVNELFNESME